ncbi:MAG: recombinase family protein [Lachnospiraceae bacterium]|nr:recombinase family protein [Lachnospiraceae bacterium]
MIGAYFRLSLADEEVGNDKQESNSIINQRITVMDYIKQHPDLVKDIVEEFIDDGYTGTNMDRPAFERMMKRIQSGDVKTVIVKDFSRFARDYIESGDYIERIFPFLGIRFIAVNDFYDSALRAPGQVQELEVVIKNIVNTSYSRDMSAKIAATNRTKQKRAMYMGGYRPFGFLSDPNDCHKLIVDPIAGKYVRMIFDLALKGNGTSNIARILNQKGIPTPSQYMIQQKIVVADAKSWKMEEQIWTPEKINKILQNEKYKGTYVAKKYVQIAPCSKHIVINNEENILRIDDAHVAIVTPEEFESAQMVLKKTGRITSKRKVHQYPFKGKVVCGYCGRVLSYFERVKTGNVFMCRYKKSESDSECTGEAVSCKVLEDIVRNALTMHLLLFSKSIAILEKKGRSVIWKKATLERKREEEYVKLQTLATKKMELYELYSEDNVDKESFQQRKENIRKDETECKTNVEQIKEEIKQLITKRSPIQDDMQELNEKVKGQEEISTELIEAFVDKLIVYNSERIEIRWKYWDEIEDILCEKEWEMEVEEVE